MSTSGRASSLSWALVRFVLELEHHTRGVRCLPPRRMGPQKWSDRRQSFWQTPLSRLCHVRAPAARRQQARELAVQADSPQCLSEEN
ncbi:hypothetical protein Cadr_000022928 [Camelus dromedarius]|uniref:Uncharacterized protein n=1 Tax=Camelus dromedarius TaxID=9838 RepID=A0A5N4CGR1_CAMDR|nr:hypothetical protein Cadr_000022928 [Camelus dromedarius]